MIHFEGTSHNTTKKSSRKRRSEDSLIATLAQPNQRADVARNKGTEYYIAVRGEEVTIQACANSNET